MKVSYAPPSGTLTAWKITSHSKGGSSGSNGVRPRSLTPLQSRNLLHLVLTASETGAASLFTVDPSGLSGGTAPDFTVNPARTGADAIVRFGDETGLAIHSSTNTFTDLLDGIDVVVRKAHADGESTSLEISRDTDGLKSRITEFVDRFNAMMAFKNDQHQTR